MYNTNWKIITCAILLSHVSSFAMMNNNHYNIEDDYDDFSDTVTRNDSISIKQTLDDINGIPNQQQNNDQQEEDKYGINTIEKCLRKLKEKKPILESYLEEMKAYINEYHRKYYSICCEPLPKDDHIKMIIQNFMSYPEYCKEFVDTSKIVLIAKKQKLKNDSIIQLNKDTINDIISKNEKITKELTNLNIKIIRLHKEYSNKFFKTSLNGDFLLYDHPTNPRKDDYLYNRKEDIANSTKVLQELDVLSQKLENDTKNIEARLEKLKTKKKNLENQLNKISKENIYIGNITNNYEQIYNSEYLELISDYKRKLNMINSINTECKTKYHK